MRISESLVKVLSNLFWSFLEILKVEVNCKTLRVIVTRSVHVNETVHENSLNSR